EFNPVILRVKTEGNAIRILEVIPIVGQSGKPVTGMPNIQGYDETPYDYTGQKQFIFQCERSRYRGIGSHSHRRLLGGRGIQPFHLASRSDRESAEALHTGGC